MTRSRIPLIAAGLALFAVGCQRSSPPGAPPSATTSARGVVFLERMDEAEAVLARLQQKAWVFKHRGGELTSEFTIYHRPEGKDQEERAIFTGCGDDAILARRAHHTKSDAGSTPESNDAGYLIVVVPGWPYQMMGSHDITYSFNLAGGAGVMQTVAAKTVYPETVFSHSGMGSGSGALNTRPIELMPGETKVLVDVQERFHSTGSKIPYLEREMLRYVLNVTALKDGQLPKEKRQ